MSEQTNQSIGYIRCGKQLADNVYLGQIEFPEGEERSCVLQFLPNDGDELRRRRFTREAMLGLDLTRDHQNLISVMHFGVWQDGRLFIALDCVLGRAVSEVLPAIAGNCHAIANIARTVLRTLAYLHDRGVVHGGVVAGNILLCADGEIRLGNFTRARRLAGEVIGSQEQKEDLIALGYLLLSLLTGTPLDRAARTGGVSLHDALPADTPAELVHVVTELLSGRDPSRPADDDEQSASEDMADEFARDRDPVQRDIVKSPGAALNSSAPMHGSYISEDDLDAFVGNLMMLFAGLLSTEHQRLHDKLLAALLPAVPAGRPDGLEEATDPSPRRRVLWAAAVIGISLLALGLSIFQAIIVPAPMPAPTTSSSVSTAATASDRSSRPVGEATAELIPDGLSAARARAVSMRAESVTAASPGIEGTISVPYGSPGAQSADGQSQYGDDALMQPGVLLFDRDGATTGAQSVRKVAFSHYQINRQGIMLSVTDGIRVTEASVILHAVVYNGGNSTFHAAQVQVQANTDKQQAFENTRFMIEKAEVCAGGRIAPGGRCQLIVWIESSDLLRTRHVNLMVAQPDGVDAVVVYGVNW